MNYKNGVVNDIGVESGGTGASTLTDHGVLLGSGTDPITPMTALAAGEIIVGVGSADPHALAAGATTTILVGGGAADPVWTEASGSGAPVRATSPTMTSPTINTGVTMADAAVQLWDIAPTSDGWSGDTEVGTTGETVAIYGLVYMNADGKWYKADADSISTMPVQAIATAEIASTTGTLLRRGVIRKATTPWTWTVGGLLYCGTDGLLTQTAPSGEFDVIQVVGIALTADTVYFDPSPIMLEVGIDAVDESAETAISITMAELSGEAKTFYGNNADNQTYTLAVPAAADVGKKFTIMKTGTGAGKAILQAGAGVTLISAAAQSSAAGTAYLAASAYGSMTWMVTSATTVQLIAADGTLTFS